MNEDLISVQMILCDAAQVADGKLYIIGGGWNMTESANPIMAIAILVTVPWSMTNRKFRWSLELMDEDGNNVMAGETERPVMFEGGFEVGRPPGLKPGVSFNLPLALNSIGTPLQPDRAYRWELKIDGNPEADVTFYTRS